MSKDDIGFAVILLVLMSGYIADKYVESKINIEKRIFECKK